MAERKRQDSISTTNKEAVKFVEQRAVRVAELAGYQYPAGAANKSQVVVEAILCFRFILSIFGEKWREEIEQIASMINEAK